MYIHQFGNKLTSNYALQEYVKYNGDDLNNTRLNDNKLLF